MLLVGRESSVSAFNSLILQVVVAENGEAVWLDWTDCKKEFLVCTFIANAMK